MMRRTFFALAALLVGVAGVTLAAPDLSEYAAASPSSSSKEEQYYRRRALQQAFAGAGVGPGFGPYGGGVGGFDPFSYVFGPDARFPFAVPPSTTVEPLGEAGAPSPALQQPASSFAVAAAAANAPSPAPLAEEAASPAPAPAAAAAVEASAPSPPVLVQPLRRLMAEEEEEKEEGESAEEEKKERGGAAAAPSSSTRTPLAERGRSLLVHETETEADEQEEAKMMAWMKKMHPVAFAPSTAFGALAERHHAAQHRRQRRQRRQRRSLAQFSGFPFQGGPFDFVFGPGSNVFTPVERATGGAFRGPVTVGGATPVSPIQKSAPAPSPPAAPAAPVKPAAAPSPAAAAKPKPAAPSPAPSPAAAAKPKPAVIAPSPAPAVPVIPVG